MDTYVDCCSSSITVAHIRSGHLIALITLGLILVVYIIIDNFLLFLMYCLCCADAILVILSGDSVAVNIDQGNERRGHQSYPANDGGQMSSDSSSDDEGDGKFVQSVR